jgi:hypothetical protein
VTPELRHLQVSLGAQISYRKAAALLRMFLPPMGGTTHTTTRSRVNAVGERIDEEIRRDIAENRKPYKPSKQMIIGIDGAFVKGRPPTARASLEIITGRIEADAEPSKVFAVVRDQDGRAKQHVQALTRQRGRSQKTKVRVVSDGEDGMRSTVGQWFNANEQHILDWYHIARRFEAIGKSLIYLPHVEDFKHRLSRHWHYLNRAMWKVPHRFKKIRGSLRPDRVGNRASGDPQSLSECPFSRPSNLEANASRSFRESRRVNEPPA